MYPVVAVVASLTLSVSVANPKFRCIVLLVVGLVH